MKNNDSDNLKAVNYEFLINAFPILLHPPPVWEERPWWFIRIKVHGGQDSQDSQDSQAFTWLGPGCLMRRWIIVFIFSNISTTSFLDRNEL